MKKNIKIAVAISGGVDSAVAAKILIDKGFQVVGIFLDLWRALRLSTIKGVNL